VSAQAAGGNIILNGSLQNWFGTSQAAPLWAGFMALVNEQAANFGVASVGFANPALYVLQSDNSFGPSFHDVVSGCNPNHANNQYCAGPGYDLVTGLGSPQSGLINGLISPSPNQCQEFLASLRVLIQNRRVPVGEVAGDRLQLKQCLQEGQITQAEYDTTLAALNALAQ
jgi:subtilase family serine protease